MSSHDLPEDPLERVLAIMARLRDPESGCPWDLRQTWETIVPHTLEEAYEVADAISRRDFEAVRGELGDLLLQVVFYARIAEEEGRFDIHDVARTLAEKLVRRHPHVFADVRYDSEAEHHAAWEVEKARERVEAGEGRGHLDGVALALPALTRAVKLQKRAARVGFDWDRPGPVLAKVLEEFDELRAEIEADAPEARLGDEVGTCCSPCAIWPGTWAWIPRPPCAAPTPGSRTASASWSRPWPPRAGAWRTRTFRSWTDCGSRRNKSRKWEAGSRNWKVRSKVFYFLLPNSPFLLQFPLLTSDPIPCYPWAIHR